MSSLRHAVGGTMSSVTARSIALHEPQPSDSTSFTQMPSHWLLQQYGSDAHTQDSTEGSSQPGLAEDTQHGAADPHEPQPRDTTPPTQRPDHGATPHAGADRQAPVYT